MPHPDRRARLDGYAKPVPELADVRHAGTQHTPVNQAQRSLLHALVEDVCRTVMRHGWYGRVHIRFRVVDGIVQADVYTGVDRNWKNQPEP